MPFIRTMTFLLLAAVAFVVSVLLTSRDVFVPPVTYPHRGVVWYSGHRYNATWNTSNPPKHITNPRGTVVLAKNRRLLLDHYLADGFDIRVGSVEVKVADVPAGDDYSIVVFGDSGNYGQIFSIKYQRY